MSRSAYINTESIPDARIYLSGVLASVVGKTIGVDRMGEQVVTLTKAEVYKVIIDMVTYMSTELTCFDFTTIQERSVGYHKLEVLMLWNHETSDQEQLTFC